MNEMAEEVAEANEVMVASKERADKLKGDALMLEGMYLMQHDRLREALTDLERSRSRPRKIAEVHFNEDVDMSPPAGDPFGLKAGFGSTPFVEDDDMDADELPSADRDATPGPSTYYKGPPVIKYSTKPARFTQEQKMKTPARVEHPLTPMSMGKSSFLHREPVTPKVRIILLMHIDLMCE